MIAQGIFHHSTVFYSDKISGFGEPDVSVRNGRKRGAPFPTDTVSKGFVQQRNAKLLVYEISLVNISCST